MAHPTWVQCITTAVNDAPRLCKIFGFARKVSRKNVGHKVMFNEYFGAKYVRTQDWKLFAQPGEKIWHLYKINEDESELNDLAE